MIEGEYKTWEWVSDPGYWEATISVKIFATPYGTYSTSYDGTWCTPSPAPKTFEEAELAALGITPTS